MTQFILLVAIGYLMGSICSAIIVCRMFSLPDPRTEGSQNPGATNVLRLAGKKYAIMVMVVDVLKGTIPVVLARALGADTITVSFTVLAAVLGHIYPIFFGFKGGKGVATAIGALLGFHLIIGVMVAATWLAVAKVSRYSSLASIVSITLSPLYTLLLTDDLNTFPPLFFMVLVIIYKHKNNITRLMDGNEPKIKLKSTVMEEIIDNTSATPEELAQEEPIINKESAVYEEVLVKAEIPIKKTITKKVTEETKSKPKAKAKAKTAKAVEPKKAAIKPTATKAKKPKAEPKE